MQMRPVERHPLETAIAVGGSAFILITSFVMGDGSDIAAVGIAIAAGCTLGLNLWYLGQHAKVAWQKRVNPKA